MFNDKDRYTADIFQRRIGEESDSNDDSDILEEQIQYNIEDENTNRVGKTEITKSNLRGNNQQESRFKSNPKRPSTDDRYNGSKQPPNNYYKQVNSNEGYDEYYQNKPQKKGRIIKKKNYNYDTYDSYNPKANYSYQNKEINSSNTEQNKTGEIEAKLIQNKTNYDNGGEFTSDLNKNKKPLFNKYDSFSKKDEIKTDFESRVNNHSTNFIPANNDNNRLDYFKSLNSNTTPIDVSLMLSNLNINAKEYVPKSRKLQQFQY